MIRRQLFAPLLALAVTATPLASQADDLARLRAEFGEVETARIAALIDDGVADGLPRTLLVEKAVEGAAKQMPAEAVHSAVATFADELRDATTILEPNADPEKLEKAADALRHGIDRGLLLQLNRDHPREFAMMIVAIEDLIHAGVELAIAEEMLREAASRGLSSDEVLGLPASVRRLVREGSTPYEAASSVRADMRAGRRVPPYAGDRFDDLPSPPLRTGRRVPPPF